MAVTASVRLTLFLQIWAECHFPYSSLKDNLSEFKPLALSYVLN